MFSGVVLDIMAQPEQDFLKVKQATDVLTREYLALAVNLSASDARLVETNQVVGGRFQNLVRELAAGTEADVAELKALYKQLDEEKVLLLDNLALNFSRLKETQATTQQKMQELRVRYHAKDDAAGYEQLTRRREDLWGQLEDNETRISQLTAEEGKDKHDFLALVERNQRIDKMQISLERAGARQVAEVKIPDNARLETSPSAASRQGVVTASGQSSVVPSINRPGSGVQKRDYSREQMQRSRDRARDQGFYTTK